jgi:molybdopterin-containing oxidoreductase family iron-sulfur binding subunit
VDTVYDLTKADVIVSLDADFLLNSPAFARYARDFASRRRPDERLNGMNRMYAVESMPTVTGTMADHKLPLRASDVEAFARGLARAVGIQIDGPDPLEGQDALLLAAADDLKRHGKHSLVIPGEQQPPVVHAIAHMINHKLGADGTTAKHIEPVEVEPTNQAESIRALTEAMEAGDVDLLVMLEVNPVFDAPSDLGFTAALDKVTDRVHLGFHYDETSEHAHWFIPATHYLESWSDARAFDGTASIVQPLIQPLYSGSHSTVEVMAVLLGRTGTPAYDLVRETWEARGLGDNFDTAWRKALHEGVIPQTASKKARVSVKGTLPAPSAAVAGVEVVLRPDPSIYDGRFANNAWLQELPRPVSKITWENAAIVSVATGKALGIKNKADDVTLLTLTKGELKIHVPAYILPGHADNSITLHLGYGRRFGGSVAGSGKHPVGVDVYPLRTREQPWVIQGVEPTARKIMVTLATTQHHPTVQESMAPGIKDRHAVRVGSIDEFRKHPHHPGFAHVGHDPAPETTLYEGYDYSKGNKWGMVIDLNTCIGCNACTIACQAENNIPTVGKEEVLKGRELHWIRLDRYWEGTEENPKTYHQPLPCMHCENAPCETVCPVGATVHSAEGLNQMVYNRCVGTRYCSNNCPYKVRRFNFFGYADHKSEHAKFQRNPNVTVRSRGVMEKCTYCVQRINAARIESKKDGNRPIKDGEVLAACQQACPAGSIAFGNLNDPRSKVLAESQSPLTYGLLTELNVLPRTTYQAKLTNPNPVLSGAPAVDEHSEPPSEEATGSHHG